MVDPIKSLNQHEKSVFKKIKSFFYVHIFKYTVILWASVFVG